MNIKFVTISVFAVVFVFASDISIAKSNSLSDDQVRQRIIDDSVASYPGPVPVPSIPRERQLVQWLQSRAKRWVFTHFATRKR